MAAKRLNRSSSGPNTSDGRMIVAAGKAASTAASPAAFERAYSDAEWGAAPIAEI